MTERKTIAWFGPARGGVRVLEDRGAGYVRVQWYEAGLRRVKSWSLTKEGRLEAIAWAQGFAERRGGRTAVVGRLTLRELWLRYVEAEFQHLRPRTRELYAEHWRRWELFLGRESVADDASKETIDRFRAALTKLGLAVGHQQRIVRDVKVVYAWAESRELLARNRLAGYRFKVAKDAQRRVPPEYRRHEVEAILAQFNPRKATEWRPWCALVIAGFQGARERAILHLAWEDVDLEHGILTWRAKYDKGGREWRQPMTLAAYCALLTARWWRAWDGRATKWVFYSPWATKRGGREEPGVYGAQAVWLALRQAEVRAGILHLPLRALHGFRRGVAGDVARASGDAWLGVQFIGDRDPDRIAEYVQDRSDALEGAAALLDRAWTEPVTKPSPRRRAGLQVVVGEAPEAGLEPATRRLTAGCSTN